MALFGKKKTEKKVEDTKDVVTKAPTKAQVSADAAGSTFVPGNILLRPRITEKAAILGDSNTYVFEVAPKANSAQVKAAVKAIYKITPAQVRFVRIPHKFVMTRGTGRVGKTGGGKKAYITLKEGDKIELI